MVAARRTPKRAPDAAASRLADELGLLVARTRRVVLARAATRLAAIGESTLAWQILRRLVHEGAYSQRALAEATGQHPAGISRLVDELEARGLVERQRDATDRRKLHVVVTAAGRRRYDEAYPQVVSAVEEALFVLTLAERRTLRRLLRKIVDAPGAAEEPPSSRRRRG